MTGPKSEDELRNLAASYSQLSREDLLIELQRLIEPAQFKEAPSDAERKREGEGIWRRIRKRVAVIVCRNRNAGGNKSVNALILAGAGAFVEEVAKKIIGEGILPGVTAATAAAVGALLYDEVQKGVDDFCEAHYVGRDEE
jgi:hypothetical protein